MKDQNICQAPWCREPWTFSVYCLAPAFDTKLCAEHAERYASDPAFVVKAKEKAAS